MSWIRMAIGVAFVGAASVASAQAPQGPQGAGAPPQKGAAQGERSGGRDARMSKRLFNGIELTTAQQEQVQKISDKFAAEKQALLPADGERQGPADEAIRAKMLDLNTKAQVEYRAILTPEQQVVYDKNVADIKARLEQRKSKQ